MKKPIKCIIFDCDGVLVDSEPISIGTIVQLANEIGIDIDYDFGVRRFVGNSWENVANILAQKLGRPLPTNFEETYRTTSFERFKKELTAVEGVLELLPQLKIPFCVASSGPPHKIRLNLQLTGLLPYFEGHVYSCYDIQKWKPDPAIYQHAAQSMGFEPTDCLVIEDSLFGVQAGVASGCQVYAYAAMAPNKADLEEAGAELFYEMTALPQLIKQKIIDQNL